MFYLVKIKCKKMGPHKKIKQSILIYLQYYQIWKIENNRRIKF